MHIQQLVLASNNAGKIREFTQIFKQLDIELIPQSKLNVPDIDEPYNTFIENALHKARHCSKFTKLPALSDDSGLCVDALNGAPGVYSARFAGIPKNDQANNQKLVNALHGCANRKAHYYCVLVLITHESDPKPIIADGTLNGEIIDDAEGTNGFGYDPHFYIPNMKVTAANLEPQVKNQISHRALAIKMLLEKLRLS